MKFNWKILAVTLGTFAVLYAGNQVYDHYKVDETPSLCLLAGEGVHLTSGRNSILMDAFFREGFPEDKLMSEGLQNALLLAEGPFDAVDLITVSHNHIDHFDPGYLMAHLARNPKTRAIMPNEALVQFNATDGAELFEGQVIGVYPERGKPETLNVNGIEVTVYNLDHRTEVENIGILVTLGGKTFFHMGDYSSADFTENGIEGMEVDYLLLPYWFLRNEPNYELIRDNMAAKYLVPIHMPQQDLPEEFAERVGSFDDLFAAVSERAENVLMLYEEGSCFKPDNQE